MPNILNMSKIWCFFISIIMSIIEHIIILVINIDNSSFSKIYYLHHYIISFFKSQENFFLRLKTPKAIRTITNPTKDRSVGTSL